MFQQNISNLGRIIGSIFIPIMQMALPVINGIVIALQDLFTMLGMKIHGDTWLKDTMDGMSQGYSTVEDFGEEFDDVTDSIESTGNAAKKLKQQLQGFDELNVLTTNQGAGAGAGGMAIDDSLLEALQRSLDEYEKKWQDSFNRMRSKAEEFAKSAKKALEPLKNFINLLSQGDFQGAGKQFSDIVVGLFDSLTNGIKKVDWNQIGENIGEFLKGIEWTKIMDSVGKLISEALGSAIELWSGAFSAAPLETAIATAIGFMTLTEPGKKIASKLEESIKDSFTKGFMNHILFDDMGDIAKNGTLLEKGGLIATTLFAGITAAWIGLNIGKWLGEHFIDEELYGNFHWFGEGGFFAGVFGGYDTLEEWWNIQKGAVDEMKTDFKEAFDTIKNSILDSFTVIVEKGVNFFLEKFGASQETIDKVDKQIAIFGENAKGVFDIASNLLKNDFKGAWDEVKEHFGGAADWLTTYVFNPIKYAVVDMLNGAIGFVERTLNFLIDGLTGSIIDAINSLGSAWAFLNNSDFTPIGKLGHIQLGRISAYANGGYPSADLFFANENGIPELVGTVGGKTAVASGTEITGISDAVYATGDTQAQLLNTAVGLLQVIAEKEFGISDQQVFNSFRRSAIDYTNRTGNPAIPV